MCIIGVARRSRALEAHTKLHVPNAAPANVTWVQVRRARPGPTATPSRAVSVRVAAICRVPTPGSAALEALRRWACVPAVRLVGALAVHHVTAAGISQISLT